MTDTSGTPIAVDTVAPKVRKSIKYRVTPERTRLAQDVVFANDPDSAIAIARERYEIPDDDPVLIERINEATGLTMRLN